MSPLTPDDIASFTRHGFMTRRIDLDPADLKAAIDMSWHHVREMNPTFQRDNPGTWTGEAVDSCRTAGIAKRRGRIKLRECVMNEPLVRKLVHESPQILEVIQALLGPTAIPRKTPRGIYPLFPSKTSSYKLTGGMDAHPFQVSCILYLTDVPDEDHGPFNLWSGSHRIMHRAFPEGRASWKMDREIASRLAREAEASCERIPIFGKAGTAVFWHHRALHTPGTNRSDVVRQVIIGDFHQSDWPQKATAPHQEDIWADWAIKPPRPAPFYRKPLEWLGLAP